MRDRAERIDREQEKEEAPARREAEPGRRPAPDGPVQRLQDMQRGIGNAAVVELLGAQAKLQVGAVHDPAEAEADRVAAQVMRHLGSGGAPAGPTQKGPELARKVQRKAAGSPASAAAGHGMEGGDVLPETASAIGAARGGGQQMDPSTLGRMESAFGADLSDVKIHTDGNAAALSRDLNAKAFTTGSDVFFGAGEYDPGSRGGQEILAHELTHTIQQGGDAQRVSRLALSGTAWAATTTFTVSSGGANGVGFLDDGNGKIALKSGEDFPDETTIASNVMEGGIGGTSDEGAPAPKKPKKKKKGEPPAWVLTTPEARALSDAEMTVVKARLNEILAEREATPRERKFVDRIGTNNGTIAFEMASGKDFGDVIKEQSATKGKGKKQKLDTTSVLGQMFTSPGMLTMLGRAGAFDVFIGNMDRLVGYFNTQNFMVDTKTNTITLVDNAAMAEAAAFTTNEIAGRGGNTFMVEAEAGFKTWIVQHWAANLCKGDFDTMATTFVGKMKTEFEMAGSVRKEDQAVVLKELNARLPDLQAWFASGLAAGKNKLLLSLNDPLKLVAGVAEDKKAEALTSVYARKFALNGVTDAAAAWRMGKANAEAILGAKKDEPEEEPEWQDNPLHEPKWNVNPLYAKS